MQELRLSWPEKCNVAQALAGLQARGLERLDAQLLLLHVLGQAPHDRAWLAAHDTDALQPAALRALTYHAQRRLHGEPLAYLTGRKEFFGLDLDVDARVLVPRPDTEMLVHWTLEVLQDQPFAAVADLGTGSGAIALALQHARPCWQVWGVDNSADALAVAQHNADRLALKVQWSRGSWLAGMTGRFDAIVSNPPYVRDGDPHLADLAHEPLHALTSGADGLDALRCIVATAGAHLRPKGWLLLEHGYDQAAAVRALLATAGFTSVASRRDLAGVERCSGGCM